MRAALASGAILALAGAATQQPSDKVTIVDSSGITVTDARAYVSGSKLGACHCLVTRPDDSLGNMTPGRSQVALQSSSHALQFDHDVKTWSHQSDDVHKVTLRPRVPVRVVVWNIVDIGDPVQPMADLARKTFDAQHVGLELSVHHEDVRELAAAIPTAACEALPALKRTSHPREPNRKVFDEGAVNVYYVGSCGRDCIAAGASCADTRAVFVYSTADTATMTHEIGHAFLGHVGVNHWYLSTGADNVMSDRGESLRNDFSTGQAIAINHERTGALAKLRLSRVPLECAVDCPSIHVDETWSDCHKPPEADPPAEDVVTDWLNCIECSDGQLERLLERASPQKAPSEEAAPAGAVTTRLSAALFRDGTDNVSTRHHRRAIRALLGLAVAGDPGARGQLREASTGAGRDRYRADVLRELDQALLLVP